MPKDIQCQSSVEVDLNYNVRQNIVSKTYRYSIYCGQHIQPLLNKTAVFVSGNLDITAMQKCAQILTGTNNYKSFCNPSAEAKNFVKTVDSITIEVQNGIINFYIIWCVLLLARL